jgi:C4-dicarboxylate-specific signal transduction histidine kinase
LAHVARLNTMGEMVAELAHELNQPLSAISSYAQACQRLLQLDSADHLESLVAAMNQVAEQADRAAGIIRRLKRFVVKAKPAQTSLDINSLVRNVAELMQLDARLAKVDIRFELADPLPRIVSDRIQIEQVLVNLMRNAIEAMWESKSESHRLTVSTALRETGDILVSLHDTGVGMTPETRRQVFDRFYTTKPDGMGMGLPISQSIIEHHGGRLWVEPNPDRGVTFFFTLPTDFAE